jgi:hypothetical protein
MMNYIDATLQASFSDASPLRRARHFSSISTRGSMGIMLHQEAWSGRLSDMVFTG